MRTFFSLVVIVLGFIVAAPSIHAARPATSLAILASEQKIQVETVGTGQSIGHVADLKIRNRTGRTLEVPIPPMVLESRSGHAQHYACPHGTRVTIGAHQEKTVPMEGLCLLRTKPPVGKGVRGELIPCDGNPASPRDRDSHLSAKDAGKIVRVAKSYGDAADRLEREHKLDKIPYHNPKKRKQIVEQWGVWSDPEISKRTGEKRATKKDLKETITRQVEQKEKEPLTPEKKQEIDRGVDEIFQDIQLTSKEAKSLEEPDPFQSVELTGPKAKSEG